MTGRQFVVVHCLQADNCKNTRAPKWVNSWRPGLGSFLVGAMHDDDKILNAVNF